MTALEIIRAIATTYAGVWATYVVVMPLLGALKRPRNTSATAPRAPSAAVIIPARNMSPVIERCVTSIRASRYAPDRARTYVVADHCDDDTADRARVAGADVLVRNEGPAGKTYTLAWTMDTLTNNGVFPDMYVIVDATARVEPGFLAALARHVTEGEDIVVSHSVVDSENQQWFAKCLGLTLVHRNFQNWARQRLRLSSLIEGRGMAYSRAYIQKNGWRLALPSTAASGSHPTEDWRHGVQAVEHGYRVAFADDARVITPLRDSLTAATQQGVRWERGRMANAATHAVRVLFRGIRRRSATQIFAALDAIQPPVAILAAFCAGLAVFSVMVPGSRAGLVLGIVPAALITLYGSVIVWRGRRDGIKASTVLWAPVYVAWRCTSFLLAWAFLDRLDLKRRKTPKGV